MWEIIEAIRIIEHMRDAAASSDAKVLDMAVARLAEKFDRELEQHTAWCEWQQMEREDENGEMRA